MKTSETPRTDAAISPGEPFNPDYVEIEFARTLERELAQANANLAAAREQAEAWRNGFNLAKEYVVDDTWGYVQRFEREVLDKLVTPSHGDAGDAQGC